jgi:5-methylcytosine-specific restriction protein A
MRQRERRLGRTKGLCERCLERGLTRAATIVDHIVPLTKDGPDVDENTRNVCGPCNAEVTAEQFGHQTPQGRGVARSGRPTSGAHPWNAGRSASSPQT